METVLAYLKNRFGYEGADRSFYRRVEHWNQWYTGNGTDFHRTKINNGLAVIDRQLSKMNMAKKVAEDWANLLLNEKTRLDIADERAKSFLLGTDGTGGVLGENEFWSRINQLTEQTFALGTGAVVWRLEGARVEEDGRLLPSPQGKIRLEYVTAPNIFPLSWEGNRVTEAAFSGDMTVSGRGCIYLQIHRKEGEEYRIESVLLDRKSGKKVPLPPSVCPSVLTGSKTPWFVFLRPNIVNNLTQMPMGISVYANALDVLKGLDLCYDSFNMEFFLGKKMVFLRKDLMMQDENGQYYAPQDCNRQLFMYIGDKNIDGDLLPQEFNPALRVEDHVSAIQQQLNYLSCQCGFGDRYYRFRTSSLPATATEVISADANLFRAIRKHELLLGPALIRMTEGLLDLGRRILGWDIPEEIRVSVGFEDSIIEDRGAEQKRDGELVALGLMLDWEFRMKYYGETEETAKARCKEAKHE